MRFFFFFFLVGKSVGCRQKFTPAAHIGSRVNVLTFPIPAAAAKCAELHTSAADGGEAELLMPSGETEGDQRVEIKDLRAS